MFPSAVFCLNLEELSSASNFNTKTLLKSYFVALIVVTTLKYINPFRNGKIILFNATYDKNWRAGEIPVFILLGVFDDIYSKICQSIDHRLCKLLYEISV